MLELAVRGGMVVTETGILAADIGIENSTIVQLAAPGALPGARRELIADGCFVLPGVIDIHFHVRAPANPERATFASETRGAAAGGVTTLLEMPVSVPSCATLEVFEARKALANQEAYINFGLYAAPGLGNRDEILRMRDAGACGYKVFTHASPKGREDEFLGICVEDEDKLYEILEIVRESGRLLSVHAENERLIQLFERRARATGGQDVAAFLASRPPAVEAMSVAQMVALCQATSAHVHLAHVSCAPALALLEAAQQMGLPMTGETCPHYLFYTADAMDEHGPFAMIKPPLRAQADQDALWRGLHAGSLLAITTDHSPFTLAEKERGLDNIWQASIGIPGGEALVPVVLTEAVEGRISWQQAVNWLSTHPAQLFDLYPRKGTIAPGADADLTLYDPRGETRLDSTAWHAKSKVTERLYHGRKVCGKVHSTVVNGQVVYTDGKVIGEPGTGIFVRPGEPSDAKSAHRTPVF